MKLPQSVNCPQCGFPDVERRRIAPSLSRGKKLISHVEPLVRNVPRQRMGLGDTVSLSVMGLVLSKVTNPH